MKKLIVTIGTRPELIKLAPVIIRFMDLGIREQLIVVNTAQHKDLLDQIWKLFEVEYDEKLDFMVSGQNLSELTARAVLQFQSLLDQLLIDNNDIVGVMAQGDTTTVMISSMVAFYNKIQFFHVEAGLRSFDLQDPFPEEFNRKIVSMVTSVHFAPTDLASMNLIAEGIKEERILVTGNTVVDALDYITKSSQFAFYKETSKLFAQLKNYENIVLVTCHRRENFGEKLKNITNAIGELADSFETCCFVWPVHPNPNVKESVYNSGLSQKQNVLLTDPLNYIELLNILSDCKVVISDSGGIQEEAPSFNVPVLVLRDKTERPEGIQSGIAYLVGSEKKEIINSFKNLYSENANIDHNPYGDGKAAYKIVNHLKEEYL